MPTIYKCETCGEERALEDKRVIKTLNSEGKPTRQETETCVFCLTQGLIIGATTVKRQGA